MRLEMRITKKSQSNISKVVIQVCDANRTPLGRLNRLSDILTWVALWGLFTVGACAVAELSYYADYAEFLNAPFFNFLLFCEFVLLILAVIVNHLLDRAKDDKALRLGKK